ncbi:MAG TPA: glycosyltransferase [Bacillota bacterium]|jgi:glycosyltransferase involved in cell wall biosynthesis|nr:glycosyltransferase [Bacillota bacterium]HOL08767.1 glycosyltransferase [Bacillota bacterium]HPO96330.1 glycosyltransferase [Bacillota bacterium]
MRVLHLLSSNIKSGAENVAIQIMRLFQNEVEMFYASPDGPIRDELAVLGERFVPVPSLSPLNVTKIKRVIHAIKPDLIHAHDLRASTVACLVAGKIPIISHLHVNYKSMQRIGFKSLSYYLCLPKIEYVFAVSDSVLNDYLFSKTLRSKCTVLYNVIDQSYIEAQVAADPNNYSFDILFLGRLCPQKDPVRLINIIDLLRRQLPEVNVAIVGEGELRGEVEVLVKERRLTNNITFLGFVSNPYKIIANSKVGLFCSVFEGYPMAALEEMLLGVPIVSTPTDGMTKLIHNGVNGFLGTTDLELAGCLFEVLTDEGLLRKLSQGAVTTATQRNNTEVYKQVIAAQYQLCLKKRLKNG